MNDPTIAVIGDLHFNHVDPAALRALSDDLGGRTLELVVVAGDLTQRARRAEFRAARDFLATLPAPSLVIPGNHDLPLFDLPLRLLNPYGRYRRYIEGELEPRVQTPLVGAIGVDATGRWRHKDGRLDAARIERGARRLRAMARPFRLVAVHQPLAAVQADDRRHVVHGAADALDSWLSAGADLVVGGHVHRGYCMGWDARARRASWSRRAPPSPPDAAMACRTAISSSSCKRRPAARDACASCSGTTMRTAGVSAAAPRGTPWKTRTAGDSPIQ